MSRSWWRQTIAVVVAAGLGAAGALTLTHHDPPPVLLSSDDIAFAQNMSGHHQQAVMMADMVAADSVPEVRALAEQIRFTQLNEIGQMTGWLQLADADPSAAVPADNGTHPGMEAGMTMNGMASPDDLRRLQYSTGPANEVQFLQLMLRHHQGGIDMAANAFRHSRNDVVRRAATLMVDEQTQETAVITALLNQRNAAPLPYP